MEKKSKSLAVGVANYILLSSVLTWLGGNPYTFVKFTMQLPDLPKICNWIGQDMLEDQINQIQSNLKVLVEE